MGFPAARVTDMHTCPMVTPGLPPVPHVGGPILPTCSPNVFTGGLPQARVTDKCLCVGPMDMIVKGSNTVLVNGLPAARVNDTTVHGGIIIMGLPTVLIGDSGGGGAGGGGFSPSAPKGLGAMIAESLATITAAIKRTIGEFIGKTETTPSSSDGKKPGAALADAAANVNPSGSVVNCGNIIDAAAARLNGKNSSAVAPASQDGSFIDIEKRFGTKLGWSSDFQSAFEAVKAGGHGSMAIIGIGYSGGSGSHVVLLANDNGVVGIVEGQNWGSSNPPEVITDVDRANTRYNSDGDSNIGWGLVQK